MKITLNNINPNLEIEEACNREIPTGWTNSSDTPYPSSKLSNNGDDLVIFYFFDVTVVVVCFVFPLSSLTFPVVSSNNWWGVVGGSSLFPLLF